MHFKNGYRVENFSNAYQFEPQHLRGKRQAYIQNFLSGKRSKLSSGLELCFDELQLISLDQATAWDLLLYEQVIGRMAMVSSSQPKTHQEVGDYFEQIEQTKKLAQYLPGRSKPWLKGLAVLLVLTGAMVLASVGWSVLSPVLGLALALFCLSIGIVLYHQARATGLAKCVDVVLHESKIKRNPIKNNHDSIVADQIDVLFQYVNEEVFSRLKAKCGLDTARDFEIIRYGLGRRIACGHKPAHLLQALTYVITEANKNNHFDVFSEVAGICGVYVYKILDGTNVQNSSLNFNETKSLASSSSKPVFHYFQNRILMYHENPYDILRISPLGCGWRMVRAMYLQHIKGSTFESNQHPFSEPETICDHHLDYLNRFKIRTPSVSETVYADEEINRDEGNFPSGDADLNGLKI